MMALAALSEFAKARISNPPMPGIEMPAMVISGQNSRIASMQLATSAQRATILNSRSASSTLLKPRRIA